MFLPVKDLKAMANVGIKETQEAPVNLVLKFVPIKVVQPLLAVVKQIQIVRLLIILGQIADGAGHTVRCTFILITTNVIIVNTKIGAIVTGSHGIRHIAFVLVVSRPPRLITHSLFSNSSKN